MKNKYNNILTLITFCVFIIAFIYIQNIVMHDFTKYNYRYSTTRAVLIAFLIHTIGKLFIKIYLNYSRKKYSSKNKAKVSELFKDCTHEVILAILSLVLLVSI